jgi:hypothetical protein
MAKPSTDHQPIEFLEEFVCTAIPGPRYHRTATGCSNGPDQQTSGSEHRAEEGTGRESPEPTEAGDQGKS